MTSLSPEAQALVAAWPGHGGGRGGDGGNVLMLGAVAPPPDDPLAVARWLAALWGMADGVAGLAWWREIWLHWNGVCWVTVSDGELRAQLYRVLEDKTYLGPADKRGNRALVGWKPTVSKINNLVDACRALYRWSDDVEVGSWVGEVPADLTEVLAADGGVVGRLAACVDGFVGVRPDGELVGMRACAAYVVRHALPCSVAGDAAGACERWLEFVGQVYGGDAESVALLQEWFGYVLSGRTDLQKMLYIIGAPRSGKGVLARVLGALVGRGQVAAPTLSAFSTPFGLSTLVDRPLAIIGDVRSSSRIDMQVVIERLLSITGEDEMSIDRKYRGAWLGRVDARVMMLSNELPWFRDASGAITQRLLVLHHRRSFAGSEDLGLEPALLGELAGVARWALEGLARLTRVGSFTVPGVSADVVREIREHTSPVGEFVAERCVVDPGASVLVDLLFTEWVIWGGGDGKQDRAAMTRFGMALRAAVPSVRKDRETIAGERSKVYRGIGLRIGAE